MSNLEIISGQATLEIDLETPEVAEIIFEALIPETESIPSERATTRLSLDGSKLTIHIQAGDLTAMRASMNSFLAWVSSSKRAIDYVIRQ